MPLEATIRIDEASDGAAAAPGPCGLERLISAAAAANETRGFAREVVMVASRDLGMQRVAVLLGVDGDAELAVLASSGYPGDSDGPVPNDLARRAVRSAGPEIDGDTAAAPIVVGPEAVGAVVVRPAQHSVALAALMGIVAQRERRAKAALDADAFHHDVLEALGAGVVATGPSGLVAAWNRKMATILGIAAADALGRPLEQLLMQSLRDPTSEPLLVALDDARASGAPMNLWRQPVVKADGSPTNLNVVVTPLKGGLAVVIEDVTDRVALESEMDRMRHMAQIGQLTAQIAHELRNPLTSIKGAAQLLCQSSDDEDVAPFAFIILQEVSALNTIADEFLDFAKPIRLNLEAIDANRLLSNLANVWRQYARDRSVRIHVRRDPRLPMIWMDAARMNQVLRNLILNAVQAMPSGGVLSLVARYDPEMNDAVIRVRDVGLGMNEEQRAHVFEPFYTTKAKGTGLGLSVVEKLVKAHGGHIAVASRSGKGTTFEIRLPAAEPVE